ncbi:MAG: helix-turn-helix transcriptional regulator [Parvibaculum sp.]|nr:helix-turn-helix transcriptional regulator [Parvibaculum sp.]
MKRPIAEIRRSAGVPQRLAAAELGIAQSTWSVYERAERAPKRRSFSRAAMLKAVTRAARGIGSGLQVDLEDCI